MRRVCVFCGSSPGARPAYADAADRLGRALAASGVGLVYGGAQVGLMGIVADSALAAGARSSASSRARSRSSSWPTAA